MPRYMLFVRGGDEAERSPEEMHEVLQRYIAWARKLSEEGRLENADELSYEGKVVRRQADRLLVTDGPYAEGKELVGGYFLVKADDEEHAVRIASECPSLSHRGLVEIRPVIEHG